MFCKYCGEKIDDDALFCQYCGRRIVSTNIIARNQSLNSKTKDELITIILRKDRTERKHTKLIQELKQELSKAKNIDNANNMVLVETKNGKYILEGNKSIGYRFLNPSNHNPLIDTIFQDVFTHDRELVDSVLVKKDGRWGLINPLKGTMICDFIYDDISQTEDDVNNGKGEITVYSNGLCGRIDSNGKVIVPLVYEEIGSYGMVKSKGLWGIFENGQEIVPCSYSFEELFNKLYEPPCV